MLTIERKIAATAALYWPGGECAALWQRPEALATLTTANINPLVAPDFPSTTRRHFCTRSPAHCYKQSIGESHAQSDRDRSDCTAARHRGRCGTGVGRRIRRRLD